MTEPAPVRPTRIMPFPNGQLGIVWEDGVQSYLDPHPLRCACACARCVDEVSGRKLLDDSRVAEDVRIVRIHEVGHYAISIEWSDGHDTGIYSWERLRSIPGA